MLIKIGWSFTLIFLLLLFDGRRTNGHSSVENDASNILMTPLSTTEQTVLPIQELTITKTILGILIQALKEQSNGEISEVLQELMDVLPKEENQSEFLQDLKSEDLRSSLESLNFNISKQQGKTVVRIVLKPLSGLKVNFTELNQKTQTGKISKNYNLNGLNQNISIRLKFELYNNTNTTLNGSFNLGTNISYDHDVQNEIPGAPDKTLANQAYFNVDKQNSFRTTQNNNTDQFGSLETDFDVDRSILAIKSKYKMFKKAKTSFLGPEIKKLNSYISSYLIKLDSIMHKNYHCKAINLISKNYQKNQKVMKYCNLFNSVMYRNSRIASFLSKVSYQYWKYVREIGNSISSPLHFLLNKIKRKEKIPAFEEIPVEYLLNTTFKYKHILDSKIRSVITYLPEFGYTTRKPLRPPGRAPLGISLSNIRSSLAMKLETKKEF
ncbi:hypothetical protein ILUMI_04440 [Ignelater luminosus]|uniref:Uncharacterized protein n=1 Tax=Ignelater luminosus TaxID=2038154 RepID=A0A8K0DEG3_IGNLU|nr:hypothetical protein ILUMI_04440 [Ignelater luminosus]